MPLLKALSAPQSQPNVAFAGRPARSNADYLSGVPAGVPCTVRPPSFELASLADTKHGSVSSGHRNFMTSATRSYRHIP
jgi:hypothetical protein